MTYKRYWRHPIGFWLVFNLFLLEKFAMWTNYSIQQLIKHGIDPQKWTPASASRRLLATANVNDKMMQYPRSPCKQPTAIHRYSLLTWLEGGGRGGAISNFVPVSCRSGTLRSSRQWHSRTNKQPHDDYGALMVIDGANEQPQPAAIVSTFAFPHGEIIVK